MDEIMHQGKVRIFPGPRSHGRQRRQVIIRARNLRSAANFIPSRSFRARRIYFQQRAMDDTQRMMKMGGFGFDPTKSLSAEKGRLDIVQHEWVLPKFEQRAEAVRLEGTRQITLTQHSSNSGK